MKAIRSVDSDERMPPRETDFRPRRSSADRWVTEGWLRTSIRLRSSGWEPPLKPRIVKLPKARKERNHPIDRLLDDYLGKHKSPLPRTRRIPHSSVERTWAWSVFFPPPKTWRNFRPTSRRTRERAWSTLFLPMAPYADHWLTFWNDLLHSDYTGTGFITGEQADHDLALCGLAGEQALRRHDQGVDRRGQGCVRFHQRIKWRGGVSAGQTVHMQFSPSVSQVFLGINMKSRVATIASSTDGP